MADQNNISSLSTGSGKQDQKSLRKFVRAIFKETSEEQRAQFFGWVLSDRAYVQQHWCNAIAETVNVTPQTAHNWISEDHPTKCTKEGQLYAEVRTFFSSEVSMAKAFCEFLKRDLLAELSDAPHTKPLSERKEGVE